WPIAD
ncbi:acrB/AcrD/AcrF family protein, partial [Vibrio parahaemolyticus VP2007-007]